MRFRVGQDERRYNALRVEAYLRLAQLPPSVVSEILRNWSKIEAILYWEGIKQGLAIGTLRAMDSRHASEQLLHGASTAVAAHAAVYGEADTPLSLAEAKHLQAIFADADETRRAALLHPWLSAEPVEFAPQTLAEFTSRYGVDAVSRGTATSAKENEHAPHAPPVSLADAATEHDDEDRRMLQALEEMIEVQGAQAREEDRPHESPAFLDRVRDELLSQLSQGWKPSGWPDLILRLHMAMHVDASYLDLQLSSDVGRAVLAQVGLFHIFPGLGVLVDGDGSFTGVREP